MKAPKLRRQHANYEKFAGTWRGDEVASPNPWDEGGPRKGAYKCKLVAGGFFLSMEYTQKEGRKTVYAAQGVFGYSAERKLYTMRWFDGMSGGHDEATGTWKRNKLVLDNASEMGHGRYTWRIKSPTEMHFLMEYSEDGKTYMETLRGVYTKK